MKYSAQEEYGLRCLLAVARSNSERGITIPEISESEGLTQPHVAKLLAVLRKAGFVRSTRGQVGGYRLAAPPSAIIVGEVLSELGGKLFEEGFCERHAGNLDECAHACDCSLEALWSEVQRAVDQVVNRYTLADLMMPSQNFKKLITSMDVIAGSRQKGTRA